MDILIVFQGLYEALGLLQLNEGQGNEDAYIAMYDSDSLQNAQKRIEFS